MAGFLAADYTPPPAFLKIEPMERKLLIVSMTFNPQSGNFFIDFAEPDKYIVSVRVSENVANCIARDLKIKINGYEGKGTQSTAATA